MNKTGYVAHAHSQCVTWHRGERCVVHADVCPARVRCDCRSVTGRHKTLAALCAMPLTMEQLLDIRGDCMADDVDIPPEALSWVESEAIKFFESGGTDRPRNEGLEGAETHAWYDLNQRQFESTDADTMLDALSAALFKVTGDEEFKKEAPPQVSAAQLEWHAQYSAG